jgi:hypothetical protein
MILMSSGQTDGEDGRRSADQRICGLRLLQEAMKTSDEGTRVSLWRAALRYVGSESVRTPVLVCSNRGPRALGWDAARYMPNDRRDVGLLLNF